MARIAGVNIPTNKRVLVALTYIHGIGPAKAREICKKVGVENYRQLLSSGDRCVVVQTLQIRGYPTLILLDQQGQMVWRHEGRLSLNEREDVHKYRELERHIEDLIRASATN